MLSSLIICLNLSERGHRIRAENRLQHGEVSKCPFRNLARLVALCVSVLVTVAGNVDTERGKEEILNRRIGENELYTIQTLLAVVDAQREYAMKDRDKNGLLEYAPKFVSDPGKKNGLYWEAKAGEPLSPLGAIVTQARGEGYQGKPSGATPSPYHGYYYKILTAQGKNATAGAYSYVVKGKMIGGFAMVAYPAEYENSGVMTFIVNHDGKVFQKVSARIPRQLRAR